MNLPDFFCANQALQHTTGNMPNARTAPKSFYKLFFEKMKLHSRQRVLGVPLTPTKTLKKKEWKSFTSPLYLQSLSHYSNEVRLELQRLAHMRAKYGSFYTRAMKPILLSDILLRWFSQAIAQCFRQLLKPLNPKFFGYVGTFRSAELSSHRNKELRLWWKQAEKSDHFQGKIEGEPSLPVAYLLCYHSH